MQLLTNDRIILPGQRLKLMVAAPDQIGLAGVQSDLGIRFSLAGDDGRTAEASLADLDVARVRAAAAFLPMSVAEIGADRLAPGAYTVRADTPTRPVAARDIAIASADQERELMRVMTADRLERRTRVEGPEAIRQAWWDGWNGLLDYLDVRPSPPVGFTVAPSGFSGAPLVADALVFAAFHVLRFAWDQVFYGGTVVVEGADEAAGRFRIRVLSRSLPVSPELPPALRQLLDSLRDDGVPTDVTWTVDGATGTLGLAFGAGGGV